MNATIKYKMYNDDNELVDHELELDNEIDQTVSDDRYLDKDIDMITRSLA